MTELGIFVSKYINMYLNGITALDQESLAQAVDAIEHAAENKGMIFVAGNGGSAAISNHLCCDFIKGTDSGFHSKLKAVSLSCNTPLITAIANDLSYQDTISYQIDKLTSGPNDLVILISSSGNSPNIKSAIDTAKRYGLKIIGLSGFSGGYLREQADISLHIPISNYGVVEDCHQSIMHMLSQYIAKARGI